MVSSNGLASIAYFEREKKREKNLKEKLKVELEERKSEISRRYSQSADLSGEKRSPQLTSHIIHQDTRGEFSARAKK